MICLNCGRPNPSGTALCSRCRQRRPGLERARGGVIYQRTRETARVTNRGPGILAVGVLLLAGLIFAGGTLAVIMGPRNDSPATNNFAGVPGATQSRLEIFQQQTPTPTPSPVPTMAITPWFPSGSPSLGSFSPFPTPGVTFPPVTPVPTARSTPRPTPKPPTPTPAPRAGFDWTQQGNSKMVHFVGSSNQDVATWEWTINGESFSGQEVDYTFPDYGNFEVTLTVTNKNGSDSKTKTVNLPRPDCNDQGEPPGCNPTPEPGTPTPTVDPTPTAESSAGAPASP